MVPSGSVPPAAAGVRRRRAEPARKWPRRPGNRYALQRHRSLPLFTGASMTTTASRLQLDPPTAPRQGLGQMATTLVGSEILRIAAEVRGLREQGRPVLDLTVGDFAP